MSEEEFVEAIFQRDLKIKKLNEKVKELENKLEVITNDKKSIL